MAYNDSMKKIQSYFDSMNKSTIILSEKFFRDYTCPEGCAGCCPKFTLDYIKDSDRWNNFKKIYPQYIDKFELRKYKNAEIYTNFQHNNETVKCEFVNWENGRCMIHKANPFSCEFELIRLITHKTKTYMMNRLFGRGWNMLRVDGHRGALCEMINYNVKKTKIDIQLLKELDYIFKNVYNESSNALNNIITFLDNMKQKPECNIEFYNSNNINDNF